MLIYLLTIVAFHTTLSVSEVLGSEAVAVTFASRLFKKIIFAILYKNISGCMGGWHGSFPSLWRCQHLEL